MENKSIIFIGAAVILFIFALNINTDTGPQEQDEISKSIESSWTMEYKQQSDNVGISNGYYVTTSYYDTESYFIQAVAIEIMKKSATSKQAIENTLEYVYYNVKYDDMESDASCFYGVGSEIIQSGEGQCDTQSIAVITILRAMGIASKPVGGCLYKTPCGIQAIVDIRPPKQSIAPTELSRGGWLHAWVEAWTPEEGWLTLESTNGLIANNACWGYKVEMYPENDDKYHICLAESIDFARECRTL